MRPFFFIYRFNSSFLILFVCLNNVIFLNINKKNVISFVIQKNILTFA